ncbi:MAG: 1-deoxy-D-xylulose-5-phosphate reductoisomerase, partial [Sphaerochaetaceae bacterium]|nr:1-deoxy-D-xylulose-5-phosphate reductoisomerase [Sphaerochaetaceae bacterium]
MRHAVILGITGSIGTTALKGINESEQVELAGFTFHNSKPEGFSCPSLHLDGNYKELREFLEKLHPDIVLNGIAGSAGLEASLACVDAGCSLALANKETIVLGGRLFLEYAANKGVKVIPVDSEHSAIDELLISNGIDNTSHLIITASGGPFLNTPASELHKVTPQTAIKHPTWKMGHKISVDSATLANKGLEVIESHFLFGVPAENIEVVIHPQSVIHSMI